MTTQETKDLFGKNLKYYRMKKGWLQTRIAYELGVHRSRISYYETGRSIPHTKTLMLLSTVLEVEVWQLFYKLDERIYEKVFNKKREQ